MYKHTHTSSTRNVDDEIGHAASAVTNYFYNDNGHEAKQSAEGS